MQLTQPKKLKSLLTTATCALLGTSAQANMLNDWQVETALLYYSETDRVSALEGIVSGQKTFANDEILSLKITIDALTGASANGAVAQPSVQTFTRPSGNGQYQISPEITPLDDTFHDTRVQFTGQWTQPLADDLSVSVGGNFSKEYDYLSLSVNGNIARDFNKNNTTLSMGMAFAFDKIDPEGGIAKAFAAMPLGDTNSTAFEQAFDASRRADGDDKKTTDLLFGLTQIINRRMIMQFNYSYSSVSGYLTDPFKMLAVVDSNGLTQNYWYENRPDKRIKQSLYWQTKYHFEHAIADIAYRYMSDDWQVHSDTIDLHLRVPLNGGHYIEPHLRYYHQSAAEFFRPFLTQNTALPQFASADYRIGEMNTYTVGVKYGFPANLGGNGKALSFRLEYYRQQPKNAGFNEPGVLATLDLYERVDAVIAQVSYSF